MAGGNYELPPRDEDPLLIDALRLRPQLPIGRFMGAEVQEVVADTDSTTDEFLASVDETRQNLRIIHELGTIEEE